MHFAAVARQTLSIVSNFKWIFERKKKWKYISEIVRIDKMRSVALRSRTFTYRSTRNSIPVEGWAYIATPNRSVLLKKGFRLFMYLTHIKFSFKSTWVLSLIWWNRWWTLLCVKGIHKTIYIYIYFLQLIGSTAQGLYFIFVESGHCNDEIPHFWERNCRSLTSFKQNIKEVLWRKDGILKL